MMRRLQALSNHIWLRYVASFALVGLGAALRVWPLDILETRSPSLTFYPAIIFAALFGGVYPGLLATLLSTSLIVFWSPHEHSFLEGTADWISTGVFIVNGTLVSIVSGAVYRLVRSEVATAVADRKRAEESLTKLEQATEQSPASIIITDLQGRIEYVNPRFTKISGYTLDEAKGKTPRILKTGHTSPEEYARLWETIRQGTEWRGIFHNRKKDGSLYWESAVVSPIKNAEGQITHFLGVKEDITDRKRMERELEEREEHFRALFENASDYVILLELKPDDSAVIVDLNDAACRLHGYEREELIGQPISIIDPEATDAPIPLLRADATVHMEARHVRKDGSRFDVEAHVRMLTLHGRQYAYSIEHDITERKQTQAALSEREKEFRAMSEHANVGIARVESRTGQFVWINDKLCDMLGHSRSELLRMCFQDVTHTDHVEADVERIQRLIRGEIAEFSVDKRYVRKDGSVLWANLNVTPLWDQGENPAHHLAMVQDISRRKAAEEALKASEERFRLTFENMTNGFGLNEVITDEKGEPLDFRILEVNKYFKEFTGIDPSDARGRTIRELAPYMDAGLIKKYCDVGLSGEPWDTEYFSESLGKSIHVVTFSPRKGQFASIFEDTTERRRTEHQIKELARQLEIERDNAQSKAATDSLTGLANRRAFDESLRKEFYRLKRSGLPMTLFMIDVDHFKEFNDTYGHMAGDDCLVQIGYALKSVLRRAADLVARYGGEEFVVILPETDYREAGVMAERARKAVEDLAIPHSASNAADRVTISVGVVTTFASASAEPESIVALADRALYRAKRLGRNRCEVLDEEIAP